MGLFINNTPSLYSVKEALCAGVPILSMSLFAEQSRNAFLAQQMGVGQCVNKANLTGEHFLVGEKRRAQIIAVFK